MTARLPKIAPDAHLSDAVFKLELHAALVARLYGRSPEDFYGMAEQARKQALEIQRRARREPDEKERRHQLRLIARVLSTLSLLTEYGPYVEGSGVVGSRSPRSHIKSVSSGGLPGHGKRR